MPHFLFSIILRVNQQAVTRPSTRVPSLPNATAHFSHRVRSPLSSPAMVRTIRMCEANSRFLPGSDPSGRDVRVLFLVCGFWRYGFSYPPYTSLQDCTYSVVYNLRTSRPRKNAPPPLLAGSPRLIPTQIRSRDSFRWVPRGVRVTALPSPKFFGTVGHILVPSTCFSSRRF